MAVRKTTESAATAASASTSTNAALTGGSVGAEEAIIAGPLTDEDISYGGGLFAQGNAVRAILGSCYLVPWDWTNPPGKNSKIKELRKNKQTGEMESKEWSCAVCIPFKSVETGEVFHTEHLDVGPLSKFWPCNGTSPYDIDIPHVRGGRGIDSNPDVMIGLNQEQMKAYAGPILARVPKAQRYFASGALVFALSLEEAGCPAEIARTVDYRKWEGLEVTVLQLPVKDREGKNLKQNRTIKSEGGVEKVVEQDKLSLQVTDYYPAGKGSATKPASASTSASVSTSAPAPGSNQAAAVAGVLAAAAGAGAGAVGTSTLPTTEPERFAFVGEKLLEMLLGNANDANPKAVTPKSQICNNFRALFPGDVKAQSGVVLTLNNAAFLEQLAGVVYDESKFTFELE